MKPSMQSLELLRKISQSVHTWHHHHHILLDIANEYPEDYDLTYAEIGCWEGASACLLLQRPRTKVIAIDAGPVTRQKIMANIARYNIHHNEFTYIYGNSRQEWTRQRLEKASNGKVDIFFIDGAHTYDQVLHDFLVYQHLIPPHGYVVFDDYSELKSHGVSRAVDQLFAAVSGWQLLGTYQNTLGARGDFTGDRGNCYVVRRLQPFVSASQKKKIAVLIATYARTDGKTPFYLTRALDSVFAQEFQDFTIYLAGDDYRPRTELDEIASRYPGNKIRLIHLDFAVEREKYRKNPEKCWNNGGVSAGRAAEEAALADGFDYICHLDHDDQWLPRHLSVIAETIEKTAADFICTSAIVPGGRLPRMESGAPLVPFLPLPGGIIHSSTCYNYRTIPIRARDAGAVPSDYDKWQRMAEYIKSKNLESIFINEATVIWEPGTYERHK